MLQINKKKYFYKSKFIRQEVLKTALKAKKGHIPPAFSWIEIAVILFYTKIFFLFSSAN
jgi:transketolase N-terminal domain/subunit